MEKEDKKVATVPRCVTEVKHQIFHSWARAKRRGKNTERTEGGRLEEEIHGFKQRHDLSDVLKATICLSSDRQCGRHGCMRSDGGTGRANTELKTETNQERVKNNSGEG